MAGFQDLKYLDVTLTRAGGIKLSQARHSKIKVHNYCWDSPIGLLQFPIYWVGSIIPQLIINQQGFSSHCSNEKRESLRSSVLVGLLDPLDKLRVFDLKLMKVLTKMPNCGQPLIYETVPNSL